MKTTNLFWGLSLCLFSVAPTAMADAPMIEPGDPAYIEERQATGDAGANVLFEVAGPRGGTTLVSGEVAVGTTIRTYAVMPDGSRRLTELRDIRYLSASVAGDLADPSVGFVDAMIFSENTTTDSGGVDVHNRTIALVRYYRDRPAMVEIHIYDNTFEWDVIGRSIERRALRAGLGIGLDIFYGSEDGAGRGDSWDAGSVITGRVSGIYEFTPNLTLTGHVEIHPLFSGALATMMFGGSGTIVADQTTDVFRGALAQGQVRLDWRLHKNVVAYLQNRFQAAAIIAESSQTIERVQFYDEATVGLLYAW